MDTGRVLAGALDRLRRRPVVGWGMLAAATGLVYVALHVVLEIADPTYLSDLMASLQTSLPAAWTAWAAAAVAVLLLGGLMGEGGLILAGAPGGRRTRGAVLRRLPALLGTGLLVWWPVLLGLTLTLGPAAYLVATTTDLSPDAALGLGGALCGGAAIGLLGWLLAWPLQRLANCAVLLDQQSPRAAVRTAHRMGTRHFGAVFSLWSALLLLNGLLLLASALLAALAAGAVYGAWTLLGGMPEQAALAITALVAALLGLGLLLWDGAVTAFTIQSWVLAYLEMRPLPSGDLLPALDAAQLLGRQGTRE